MIEKTSTKRWKYEVIVNKLAELVTRERTYVLDKNNFVDSLENIKTLNVFIRSNLSNYL